MVEAFYWLVAATYVHDLSPFALKFGDGFGIRWYGLAYLAGFACAYYLMTYFSKVGLSQLTKQQIGDFVFAAAVGTLVGGRLGYCVFYNPSLFTTFSSSIPFWGVLEVNKGGMASHGGIIGILVACTWFARKHNLKLLHLLDLVAVTGPLGVFFGRLANFVNGELFGRETTVSWAVKFPREIFDWSPTQLLTLTPVVEKLNTAADTWNRLVTMGSYQVYGLLDQIITRIQAGDALIKIAIAPLLTSRHPSQLYEALAEGLFLFTAMLMVFIRNKRPGFAVSAFLILYPLGRIICEQYRLPDTGIGYQLWGLTRGQWLSIAMMVLGIGAISFFCFKGSKSQTTPKTKSSLPQ